MLRLFRRIRERARTMGRRVQALAVHVALFLLYVFGFGMAHLFALVFHRGLLFPRPPRPDSFWLEATDYGLNPEDRQRQS